MSRSGAASTKRQCPRALESRQQRIAAPRMPIDVRSHAELAGFFVRIDALALGSAVHGERPMM